jgi:diaminopimelate decarboxylase
MAVSAGIGRVIVDNFDELAMLDQIAGEWARSSRYAAPHACGDAHTHRLIQTGRIDTKFGFNIEGGSARRAVEAAMQTKNLELLGVVVTSVRKSLTRHFSRSPRVDDRILAEIRDDLGVQFPELDLGGGLGIRYLPEQTPPSMTNTFHARRNGARTIGKTRIGHAEFSGRTGPQSGRRSGHHAVSRRNH